MTICSRFRLKWVWGSHTHLINFIQEAARKAHVPPSGASSTASKATPPPARTVGLHSHCLLLSSDKIRQTSDSQVGQLYQAPHPWGRLPMPRDIFVYHNLGWRWGATCPKPRMLLNIRMNRTALTIKNYPAPNVDSTEVENPETDHVKSMLGDKLSKKTNESCHRKVKKSDDFLAF